MLQNVMLEKTLESLLDSKGIKSVNPKGNQPWIFIERIGAKPEGISNTLATWCKEPTHWRRHCCWERLKAGGQGDDRGWDGWMASRLNGHEFAQAPGDGDGQGSLACCSPWGQKIQIRLRDWTIKFVCGRPHPWHLRVWLPLEVTEVRWRH